MSDFMKAAGVIPWKEGDELPEDVIRRLRDKEQVTFDGIPIPLTMETLVDVMEKADYEKYGSLMVDDSKLYGKRLRQVAAFRERILRVDAEKDKRIDILRAEYDYLFDGSKEMKARIADIEEHNTRLEEEVKKWKEFARNKETKHGKEN